MDLSNNMSVTRVIFMYMFIRISFQFYLPFRGQYFSKLSYPILFSWNFCSWWFFKWCFHRFILINSQLMYARFKMEPQCNFGSSYLKGSFRIWCYMSRGVFRSLCHPRALDPLSGRSIVQRFLQHQPQRSAPFGGL